MEAQSMDKASQGSNLARTPSQSRPIAAFNTDALPDLEEAIIFIGIFQTFRDDFTTKLTTLSEITGLVVTSPRLLDSVPSVHSALGTGRTPFGSRPYTREITSSQTGSGRLFRPT